MPVGLAGIELFWFWVGWLPSEQEAFLMEAGVFTARGNSGGHEEPSHLCRREVPSRQNETHRHALIRPGVVGRPSCLVNLTGGVLGGEERVES